MKNPNWRKCILNSDSRDVIKRIPNNSIDLILTDPPYNLGQHSTGNIPLPGRSAMNNDVAEWDMIDFNPEEWADEFVRILKPTGNLFIFTSYNQIGRWYDCLDHKFDTSNFMVWHKTNPAPKIFKAGFLNSCEMIFTCWNKKHTWNFISQKEMHNFLESPICMRPERLSDPKHPTQKPVSILKKIIDIASNENDIVFDPFMGVGSTGVAALEKNRKFIGVEIEPDYFIAAKARVETVLKTSYCEMKQKVNMYNAEGGDVNVVSEAAVSYVNDNLNECFKETSFQNIPQISVSLSPIIKWPGGKEKELKYILPNIPDFNRYFEPFVGGGAVYTAIKAEEYFINDLSSELVGLYNSIASKDKKFYNYVEMIDTSWKNATAFVGGDNVLVDVYIRYRDGLISKEDLRLKISSFCKEQTNAILSILNGVFTNLPNILISEVENNLFRKMTRMKELEFKKNKLPMSDLIDNIETAFKSALYMNYRYLYNKKHTIDDDSLTCALFFFLRNYAYSGMFRYSNKGEFNVPYGGIAYNNKLMDKKIRYYSSNSLQEHLSKTKINCMDFEDFLRTTQPTENDFVFLDPPYDTEFSTYAQNAFTRDDQERLADYMLNECKAKWMLVIKYTDFIYNLYNRNGIKIRSFDKEYLVSFMNRNNKKVTHLLITNY